MLCKRRHSGKPGRHIRSQKSRFCSNCIRYTDRALIPPPPPTISLFSSCVLLHIYIYIYAAKHKKRRGRWWGGGGGLGRGQCIWCSWNKIYFSENGCVFRVFLNASFCTAFSKKKGKTSSVVVPLVCWCVPAAFSRKAAAW